MKKVLAVLVLISFLAVLVVPTIAIAQVGSEQKPPECCKLKRIIKIDTTECAADGIVGPKVGDACPLLGTGAVVTCGSSYWGMYCMLNTLYNITDWIFVILVALAALFVIIGAMTLLMAAGNPERVASGRNFILYAMVGLLVGFLAKAVPGLVKLISGF